MRMSSRLPTDTLAARHAVLPALLTLALSTPALSQTQVQAGTTNGDVTVAAGPADQTAQTAESRFADARRVTRTGGGHLEETKGLLISDPKAKEIRFEEGDRPAFAIPYDWVTAMHYGQYGEAKRSFRNPFWTRPLYYLTVHYVDAAGQARFETVRWVSERAPALDALETETGLRIDHAPTQRSFLGIPIRVTIGDRVTITDLTGRKTTGKITQLSATALALDGSTGAQQSFADSSVQRVRLPYSLKRGVLVGFASGAIYGASSWMLLLADSGEWTTGDAMEGAALFGAGGAVLGAVIGPAVGAVRHRFDRSKDVYVGGTTGASRTSVITVGPQIAKDRKGVLVSVGF